MNAKQIWQTTLDRLQTRFSPAVFITWFQGTIGQSFQDGVFTVEVPTTFARSHLDGRFREVILPLLIEAAGTPLEVKFVVAKKQAEQAEMIQTEPLQPESVEEAPRPAKRSYRLGKGRLSAVLRGKRGADNAATVLNMTAPTIQQAVPHRTRKDDSQQQSLSDSRLPLLPMQDEEGNEQAPGLPLPKNEYASPSPFQKNGYTSALPVQKKQEASFPVPSMEGLLNPRYTFSTFIVGKSNQLAHAASFAAAENPGRIYNPLFLYGGVGLGKTHLLHAVGHAGERANLNVLYVTSEKFTNEIINAIRFQKTEEFRAKYREIDILLVDDIQFIAGKESTEEEFFHTFNYLHNANKQIVVTSDRPPKAISSLQDRLRSRFEWGLLADVQAPEYEHRLAILRSKAESLRFTVPPGVIDYIARPPCSSVRELEGALNRVIAYATLHDAPITVNLAVKALEHLYDTKPPVSNVSVEAVLAGVCHYYRVTAEMLRGKQRDRNIAWPRQVAMYLMREEASASLLQIGTALGGRDHTTILHGCEKVQAEVANNEVVRQEIAAMVEMLHHPVAD